MKILSRYTNACLWESNHETVRATMLAAVAGGADLGGANLGGADLGGAIVAGCALGTATFTQYLEEVVPALLVAGGVTLREILDSGA